MDDVIAGHATQNQCGKNFQGPQPAYTGGARGGKTTENVDDLSAVLGKMH